MAQKYLDKVIISLKGAIYGYAKYGQMALRSVPVLKPELWLIKVR